MMGCVYRVTNNVNGKVYIGKTVRSLGVRWQQHCCDAKAARYSNKFHNALRSYGQNNFTIDVVASVNDPHILNEAEKISIEHFDTYKNGYNSTLGGNGLSYKARRRFLNTTVDVVDDDVIKVAKPKVAFPDWVHSEPVGDVPPPLDQKFLDWVRKKIGYSS